MQNFLKCFLVFSFFIYNNITFANSFNNPQIKIGISKHSVKSGLKHTYEKGYDLNIEYMFLPTSNKFFKILFSPYIHIGTNLNAKKATSMLYTGFTWKNNPDNKFLIEISLGGCIHNGQLKYKTNTKQALGSRLLFRESISLGINYDSKKNIALFLEHSSNAKLAHPNPGLTNFGIRYGFEI